MLKPFRNWVNRKLGEIRKARWFPPTWHTGAVPPVPDELVQNKSLKARIRQILIRSPKAIWFPLYHTGATPPAPDELIQNKVLKARIRQALTRSPKAIWFPLYHTGATPPVPPTITQITGLKARIRSVFTRSPKAIFFPLFHTGAEPLTFNQTVVKFSARKREVHVRSAPRMAMFMPAFAHVGAVVPPPIIFSWVSPRVSDSLKRGG